MAVARKRELLGTHTAQRGWFAMRYTPTECRDHVMHCRRMAAIAPQALAMEFERLAQTWARLADELERAHALTESPPDPPSNIQVTPVAKGFPLIVRHKIQPSSRALRLAKCQAAARKSENSTQRSDHLYRRSALRAVRMIWVAYSKSRHKRCQA